MDAIITVCGNAANEVCPIWSGSPVTAFWDIDDPANAKGNEAAIDLAFSRTFDVLNRRVDDLSALDFEGMNIQELQVTLGKIGKLL